MQTLRPYQREAGQFLARHRRGLLALPPGAGKTAIVSAWAGDLEGPMRALIVAPNGPVLRHWQHELLEWGNIGGLGGTGTPARREKHRTMIGESTFGALVLNYECMRNDIEQLLTVKWDAVVFDESHRLKGRKVTFKAAARLAKAAPNLALVSGTPVLSRASELWTSLHLLDPATYRSYWRWAEAHFHIVYPRYRRRIVREICSDRKCGVCGGKGVLPDHVQILKAEIGSRMFYRPLKEILPDLPPVIETHLVVELSPEERKAHDSMMDNFWMEVGADLVLAANSISRTTQLRKLCSDWSVFGEGAGTKVKTAAQLIEDLDDEQCVVFCAFRNTADALAALVPGAKAYHGGLNEEQRNQLIEAFKVGELRTLVATIATLGEGVDGLQVARNVIMLDRDWTPARNTQAIGRLQRQGQQSAVNVIHVVAADTIDNTVADALAIKQSVVQALIESR